MGVLHDFIILYLDVLFAFVNSFLLLFLAPFFLLVERMRQKRKHFKSIFITGGNSGIGEALALEFAEKGVRLVLSARREDKLQSVAKKCREKGAVVTCVSADVTDAATMEQALRKADDEQPLDLIIANAGVTREQVGVKDLAHSTEKVFDVNVNGVFHTIFPLLPRFLERNSGQIAIMSSMSGFGTLPVLADYGASKAAERVLGQNLRHVCKFNNVAVNVISPGYVQSEMTASFGDQVTSLWPADRAVKFIRDGLERNVAVILFPPETYLMAHWMDSMHPTLRDQWLNFLVKRRRMQRMAQLIIDSGKKDK